jgi:hypothetical protein
MPFRKEFFTKSLEINLKNDLDEQLMQNRPPFTTHNTTTGRGEVS